MLRLRARHYSVAIIFLLDERDAITAADLRDLDVEGDSVERGLRQERHRLCRERASRPQVGRPRAVAPSGGGGTAVANCDQSDLTRS